MATTYRQLNGIEVLSCTDAFAFRPHIHDRYVVWLNTRCGEHFTVKGNRGILQPGSVSIFEPGLVHANHPCSDSRRHLRSFYVDPAVFNDLARQCGRPGFPGFVRQSVKDPDLWRSLAALHDEILGAPYPSQTEDRVVDTFTSLLTRHGGIGSLKDRPDTCDRRISKAIEYFRSRLDREIRIKDLAAELGCTQFHLIRLFRAHKGLSPHAFLRQLRLEHARTLLSQGRPIAQTALESGFSDQSHLTRAFKRRYGITPRVYQTQGTAVARASPQSRSDARNLCRASTALISP